ncbi:protein amnionless-like [Actinia tenebrosa]|uniref:Protein amnionless n=1 Tax=Actinia tenebrosa TaxID=6105 RepID=A0A6P8ISY0_ACTTE|nr:protein amnionless-like [Actinia tenebrosa]
MEKLLRLYLLVATLLLAFNGHSHASAAEQYKTWIPNTNWNNGENWASGRVPCPLQDVQLGNPQNSSPLSIALTGQNALKSLSLPMNGELIFHKDAELTFYQDREVVLDKCTAKGNIQFIASVPKMWYNPNNWKVTDNDGNPVLNDANAIIHLEKVPCQHDQVLFPKDSSFNVASTKPITVASLTINGKSYSQSSFKEFLSGDSGAMQFHLSISSMQLTGQICNDPKGCLCNTNQEKTTICNHVTCVVPLCNDPLEPIGSCCTYCGAVMMVKPGASFRLEDFKSKILSLKAKFKPVSLAEKNGVELAI